MYLCKIKKPKQSSSRDHRTLTSTDARQVSSPFKDASPLQFAGQVSSPFKEACLSQITWILPHPLHHLTLRFVITFLHFLKCLSKLNQNSHRWISNLHRSNRPPLLTHFQSQLPLFVTSRKKRNFLLFTSDVICD